MPAKVSEGAQLIYQDVKNGELFDVFFLTSQTDLWHMKTLNLTTLEAQHVHHLTRNAQNQLEKTETLPTKTFSFDPSQILTRYIPPENRPLSTLLFQPGAATRSHFYYKLLAPLTPLLLLFPIAPISLRYGRHRPVFLTAAFALFGYISYKVLLDGLLILAENQALPPLLAIFCLPLSTLLAAALPFIKMR